MKKQMQVIVVEVDLLEESGRFYFPIEDPISWEIAINTKATEILVGCPAVVESMIEAIRGVVAQQRGNINHG